MSAKLIGAKTAGWIEGGCFVLGQEGQEDSVRRGGRRGRRRRRPAGGRKGGRGRRSQAAWRGRGLCLYDSSRGSLGAPNQGARNCSKHLEE